LLKVGLRTQSFNIAEHIMIDDKYFELQQLIKLLCYQHGVSSAVFLLQQVRFIDHAQQLD